MARIAGVELPETERVLYALTRIYGIGPKTASRILKEAKVDPAKRTKELTEEEIAMLTREVEGHKIEGDLLREVRQNIQRLREISAYRGVRHVRGLPVRGQRTRTNARTKRGKRRTVGAFKKEALAKMTSQQTKQSQ